ncbi:MAG: hypothetical protein FD189_1082 [Elusimicrobia bacterium]|nr:MAG: hypothetical protein FD189_1082 [Elusimicrobiota bacterium]
MGDICRLVPDTTGRDNALIIENAQLRAALEKSAAEEESAAVIEVVKVALGDPSRAQVRVPGGLRGWLGCFILGLRLAPGDAWLAPNALAWVRKFAHRWLRIQGKWQWAKVEINRLKAEAEARSAEIRALKERLATADRLLSEPALLAASADLREAIHVGFGFGCGDMENRRLARAQSDLLVGAHALCCNTSLREEALAALRAAVVGGRTPEDASDAEVREWLALTRDVAARREGIG